MSAFIVEDKVINRVVYFFANEVSNVGKLSAEFGFELMTDEGCALMGLAMFRLNCEAVNERYGSHQADEFRNLDYSYQVEVEITSEVQTYKSLRCWLYQCSEGNIPETSPLFAAMEKAAAGLAEHIVMNSPAYDKAEW